MDDLTQILAAVGKGVVAADRLLDAVYADLRRMAASKLRSESSGQTLQATALVHEAWIRLLNSQGEFVDNWENRRHFFGAASEAMRRILIEKARAKKRHKRGGPNAERVGLDDSSCIATPVEDEILDLHDALALFEQIDAQKAQIVKLKFFAGLTTNEVAEVTQLSVATVERYWAYARVWLFQKMSQE